MGAGSKGSSAVAMAVLGHPLAGAKIHPLSCQPAAWLGPACCLSLGSEDASHATSVTWAMAGTQPHSTGSPQ